MTGTKIRDLMAVPHEQHALEWLKTTQPLPGTPTTR